MIKVSVKHRSISTSNESQEENIDVPAAILCARCGKSDCFGCDDAAQRSGVVQIVAWERQGPFVSRLWRTSLQATMEPTTFFANLPDGAVGPALSFAVACECAAASSLLGIVALMFGALFPDWTRNLMVVSPATVIFGLLGSIVMLASILVVAHLAHGLFLHIGLVRAGVRQPISRTLRFGLYACGWDLIIGLPGMVGLARLHGIGGGLRELRRAMEAPRKGTLATIESMRPKSEAAARTALYISYAGAAIATLLAAISMLGIAYFFVR